MMNEPTEHKREHDEGPPPRMHRRSTDTGVRGWVRRNLGWLSYILLALAIAFSLQSVQHESSARRTEIVTATQRVIYDSCERGNDTRELLRGLILQGNSTAKQYLKEGLFTQAQYERAVRNSEAAAAKLKSVDCRKAVERVKVAGVEE